MKPFFAHLTTLSLSALIMAGPVGRPHAEARYDGVTLNLASQNDQFAAVLDAVAPKFEALTGAKVKTVVSLTAPAAASPSVIDPSSARIRGSRQIQLVVHLSREFSVDCPVAAPNIP